MAASPSVTAGLRCAPLNVPTAYTATVTPNAQPAVMTIQPEFWPLVLLSTTLATTPSPRMMSSMVPSSSARNGDIGRRSYVWARPLSTSTPHRRLLRPRAVLIPLGKRAAGRLERRRIPRCLIRRDTRPVQRFGRCIGPRELLHDFAEPALGLGPLLLGKRQLRSSQHQLRQQVIRGKETLNAVLRDAVRIEQQNRRGPRRPEPRAEALEGLSFVLHVYAGGKKVLVDEADDTLIRPHLGIQPSTATSHRRGAEVEENGLALRLCVLEDLIYVVTEIGWHKTSFDLLQRLSLATTIYTRLW